MIAIPQFWVESLTGKRRNTFSNSKLKSKRFGAGGNKEVEKTLAKYADNVETECAIMKKNTHRRNVI